MMNCSTWTLWAGRKWFSVLLSLCLLLPAGLSAQSGTGTVSGKVVDESGEPFVGVSVVVQGTTQGVSTGVDGTFTLANVNPSSAVLVFSFLGYHTQTIAVDGRSYVEVALQQDVAKLDEVVVIGYGSLARRELSSSIVNVSKEDFQQGAMSNPMELLTGKVAGLNVNNTSLGDPNYSSNIQIRGATSASASNDPLIIIDGIAGGNLRTLSTQDIESMTVLKDGASSAIYGTRSANGVIIVTTKKGAGSPGNHAVTYDSWFGVNLARDIPEVLDSEEFRRSMRSTDYGYDTDWYKELLRNFSYDHNQYVSFDGSGQNNNYSASFNYRDATGLDIASSREEFGGRFAASQKALGGILELNGSLSARKVKEKWGDGDQFRNALVTNPTYPVYNEDGSFYHPAGAFSPRNPVEELTDHKRGGERMYVLGSAEIKLNILRGPKHSLNTSLNYSLQYDDLNQYDFVPSTTAESVQNGYRGRASLRYEKWWANQVEWLANYTFESGDHTLRAVAGYSYTENNYENRQMENRDFTEDDYMWHSIQSGTWLGDGKATMSTGKNDSKLIGVFGRVNYSWKGILMGSASLRYEGSTRFGADNKWGYFPAASVAWEMANMNFLESGKDWINSLKLRVSYGETGRSDFGNYQSLSTYGNAGRDQGNRRYWYLLDGSWVQGMGPTYNANPDLGWEKAITTNFGIDFSFWGRLSGSLDYYNRKSKDLLFNYLVPQPPAIQERTFFNLGTTTNNGFELSLNGDIIRKKDFSWNAGIVYSHEITKFKEFSNTPSFQFAYFEGYEKPGIGGSEYLFRSYPDDRVGNFFGYEHAGVDEDGYLLFYNKDGVATRKGSETEDDKRVIGNGAPKNFLSFNNTIRYKNFDLNIFFRGAFGFDVFNYRKYEMGTIVNGNDNVLRTAYTDYGNITRDAAFLSSFYLEKGDYFKLENVTLGYTVPFKNVKYIDNLRIFISAKNLFTLTGYDGTDPSKVPVTGLTPGVDNYNSYPNMTQISMGVTLRFK